MDAKVFHDLRNRDAGLAVHPDAHDVFSELLAEGLGIVASFHASLLG